MFTEELQVLVSRRNTYDLVFPTAALHVANLDGGFSQRERDLYRALLSRMSFPEHTPAELQRLVDDETSLIEAATRIKDREMRRGLMGVMVLMAVCDGELADEERAFLANVSERLKMPLDLDVAERKARDYRALDRRNAALETAGSAVGRVVTAGNSIRGRLGKAFKRDRSKPDTSTATCPDCGGAAPAGFRFCPDCGRPASRNSRNGRTSP